MFRLALILVLIAPLAACHKEPAPVYAEQPLPPASGTPIGYLIDNAGQLQLTDEQVGKLKRIDESLSARNDAIDTQLREIEKPEPTEPEDPKHPSMRAPNMAPGAAPVHTTKDSGKLHEARIANNKEALEKAFAVLQPPQQETAKKLLAERGIASPTVAPAPASAPPGRDGTDGPDGPDGSDEPMPAPEP